MNDSEFNALTDDFFRRIMRALETADADMDFVQTASGCFEIEFEKAGKIIINRHESSKEIWVAARSGGWHFHWDGEEWRDTRTGEEIRKLLSGLILQQGNISVTLDSGQSHAQTP